MPPAADRSRATGLTRIPLDLGESEKPPPPPSPGILATVFEALRGSHIDFTEAPLPRAVLLLAIPMILEMALESVFAVVDILFVAKLGADAVAAVGLTESMLAIVYAIGIGLAMGTAAVVARRTGEKNPEAAAAAAGQALLLGVLVSIPIGIAGWFGAPRLLALLGGSPEVVAVGSGFTRIVLAGNVVIILLFLNNAVLRGAGDAAAAMRLLWLSNLVNLALDPCLIFGLGPFPRLGVTGAAVATTTGRAIGVAVQLVILFRGRLRVKLRPAHLVPDFAVLGTLARVSATGILQNLIGTTSWIGLVRILSGFGSAALAGYTIAIRVVIFALLPSWGMSNAAATLVGQNLGAGRPDRSAAAVRIAGRANMAFLGAIGLGFFVFAGPIVAAFTNDGMVAGYAVSCLRIVSVGFPFYAWGMVVVQAFNGAGDTWTPAIVNFGCFWVWEIPLAVLLSRVPELGPDGVFLAITIAFSTLAVVAVALFRRGKWAEKRL